METLPFWLWNRNCPYFADSGAADILVEEQEPPLFCRCCAGAATIFFVEPELPLFFLLWRCCYFGCGTGTALILPTLETLPFWLWNRNSPYFADSGDAAILVTEQELPLFFRLWGRRHFGCGTGTALILPTLETAPTATLFQT